MVSGVRSSTSASASSVAATSLHMTHPSSVRPVFGSDTYDARQPAQSRSRLIWQSTVFGDFFAEARFEVVECNVAFGIIAATRVHTDGAVLDIGIADHEHVGNLLRLGS